jgi:hypothetical protein
MEVAGTVGMGWKISATRLHLPVTQPTEVTPSLLLPVLTSYFHFQRDLPTEMLHHYFAPGLSGFAA